MHQGRIKITMCKSAQTLKIHSGNLRAPMHTKPNKTGFGHVNTTLLKESYVNYQNFRYVFLFQIPASRFRSGRVDGFCDHGTSSVTRITDPYTKNGKGRKESRRSGFG